MVPFVLAGMAAFGLAALIMLPLRSTLDAHGHGDWISICVAGFFLGFLGLAMMLRHDANRRRRRAAQRLR